MKTIDQFDAHRCASCLVFFYRARARCGGLCLCLPHARGPNKKYVTQSIPRLAREVLYGLYGSSLNISSLYRSIDQPSKQRRARGYTLTSVDIDRLNELLNLYGGATFVIGRPELWCFDLASIGV